MLLLLLLLAAGVCCHSDTIALALVRGLENNERMSKLRTDVESFAGAFEMPGFDVHAITQQNGAIQNGAMQNGHH